MRCSLGFIFLALFALAGFTVVGGQAGAVTVSVIPSDTTVTLGDEFYVRVVTDDVPVLKAFELIYSYDPTPIQLLGIEPGDALTGAGNQYAAFVLQDYTAPADSIWYDAAMLGGATQGPGILAFFKLKALAPGESPVHCELVDFRDTQDVQTLPDCVSGVVHVMMATSVSKLSWGRLKALYR